MSPTDTSISSGRPARVTLARDSQDDVGERQVIARVDDGERATLYYGDRVTLELEPGEHRLRSHNTLVWKTVPFTIEPGEHLEFVLVNYAPRFTFSLLALVGAGPLFLRVERRAPSEPQRT